jgi:hypothetical protein
MQNEPNYAVNARQNAINRTPNAFGSEMIDQALMRFGKTKPILAGTGKLRMKDTQVCCVARGPEAQHLKPKNPKEEVFLRGKNGSQRLKNKPIIKVWRE